MSSQALKIKCSRNIFSSVSIIILATLLMLNTTSLAQSGRKMENNFKVFVSENFDKKASITIQKIGDDRGASLGSLSNSLASRGFKTISSTAISNKTEIDELKIKDENSSDKRTTISNTNYVKSNYLFTVQYSWASIPGRIQCMNFTGQIVDLNNESEIIATFGYAGKFDMLAVAEEVADRLKSAKVTPKIFNEETGKPTDDAVTTLPQKSNIKTKEERLIELKQFYEKELITKEEYEQHKMKILSE